MVHRLDFMSTLIQSREFKLKLWRFKQILKKAHRRISETLRCRSIDSPKDYGTTGLGLAGSFFQRSLSLSIVGLTPGLSFSAPCKYP
jgi:hypothetical protein